ncbi:UNVERIFIED_CONTAM: hypothetical protein Sindi_2103800 [Sesamum indicum]
MVNPGERHFMNDHRINDVDQNSDGEESIDVSSSGSGTLASGSSSIMRRLTEVLVEDGDEDLLLQGSSREDGVLQWIRALDMQVMGACRADERLKPLLKLNVSTGVAEDRLLAHLSQPLLDDFETSLTFLELSGLYSTVILPIVLVCTSCCYSRWEDQEERNTPVSNINKTSLNDLLIGTACWILSRCLRLDMTVHN